jgi:hypothetical protein
MLSGLVKAFEMADLPAVIHQIDRDFGGATYSLRSLFRDEQRKILSILLRQSLEDVHGVYRELYARHAPLMRFLVDVGTRLPDAFRTTAQFVLNGRLWEEIQKPELDGERIQELFQEARRVGAQLERESLAYTLAEALERRAGALAAAPHDLEGLAALQADLEILAAVPFEVDLSGVQNRYWKVLQCLRSEQVERERSGDQHARSWLERFDALAGPLNVRGIGGRSA